MPAWICETSGVQREDTPSPPGHCAICEDERAQYVGWAGQRWTSMAGLAYGGWWGRVVVQDGAGAVRRSADRYVARLHGVRPAT